MNIFLIPDGNRRWSKANNKESWEGYTYLPKIINMIIKVLISNNITKLHFHCNSINNLKRNEKEVRAFLDSYLSILEENKDIENGIKIHLKGNLDLMPFDYKKNFEKFEEKSRKNTGFDLYLYLNYSTKDDLQRAIVKSKSNDINKIISFMDEPKNINIIIKTGKRKNLSGFTPIKSINTIFQFENCYAPELKEKHIQKAIKNVNEFETKNGL